MTKINKQILNMESEFKKLTRNPFKLFGSYSGLAAFIVLLASNIQLKPVMWLFDFFYATFSMLMGDEVGPRREFIQKNAHIAEIDI